MPRRCTAVMTFRSRPWVAGVVALGLVASIAAISSDARASWHLEGPSFAGQMSAFLFKRELRPAPDFQFSGPQGEALALSDFRNRVVLLNFWATWCPPCVEEMPSLDRLQARLGGRDFEVIALSLDRGGLSVVNSFFTQSKLTNLRPYLDSANKAMRTFRLGGLPTTIMIDRRGRIIGTLAGPAEWDSADAEHFITYLIEGSSTAGR